MWHEVQEQLLQLEADSRLITALLFKTSNNKCIMTLITFNNKKQQNSLKATL